MTEDGKDGNMHPDEHFHKLMQQLKPGPFPWGGCSLTVIGIVLFWFAWRYWSQKS